MSFVASTLFASFGLFFGMLALLEVGRRFGERRLAKSSESGRPGFGAVEGSVFGLMGLLIAFTFSSASARFEGRRHLVVEEANAIGTAWLRIDLLSEPEIAPMRERFRAYLDARLAAYGDVTDMDQVGAKLASATLLQQDIWTSTLRACREPGMQQATMLLLPALNAMFDVTTSRTMAARFHQPTVVFVTLFAVALASSLLAGYGLAGAGQQRWVPMLGFALITSIAIYVITDLEYPRLGFIRVDAADQALIELRQSMK